MNTIVPFGYYTAADIINYDFKELRQDDRFSLNRAQRMRYPDAPHTVDMKSKSTDFITEKYLRILENYPTLRDLLEAKFNMFAYKMIGKDYKFKITTSWLTRLDTGDCIHPHSHHNCFYSGILYYGKDYSDAIPLTLTNPLLNTVANVYAENSGEHNLMWHNYTLQPFPGALYFWPSHIQHYSELHTGESRFSLAFNFAATEDAYLMDSSFKREWVTPEVYGD
tara:strand:- start:407 stop:1075 length:669 start_codon:yes stop_codon:yes gene_type:complete